MSVPILMQDASRPLASQLPFEVNTYLSPISQRDAQRERTGWGGSEHKVRRWKATYVFDAAVSHYGEDSLMLSILLPACFSALL